MQFTGNNAPPAPMGAPAPMGSGQVVSLTKGQKVSLSKVAPALKKVMVGLGWDTNKYDGGYAFDLDASAFLCAANDKSRGEWFIFYNNLDGRGPDGSWPSVLNECCVHQGDNLTGEGDGDDEQILIDLEKVPAEIQKIAITVTIHDADVRRQNFGAVSNAFIRLVNKETGAEILRYDLGEEYSVETALVVAEIYRYNGEWRFNAIGAGFQGGLAALCNNYGVDVD